jgi:dipeptidyl aminopeptidase/acylaminoacyl peptidase
MPHHHSNTIAMQTRCCAQGLIYRQFEQWNFRTSRVAIHPATNLSDIEKMLVLAALTIAQSFTIDQAMSAPFSSELIAQGKTAVWIQNEKGRRNIYGVNGALTNYSEDDGQEIGQMQITPDGKFVIYTRGGDLEMGREIPNPLHLGERPGQAIWKVATDGSKNPVKIADGHSPAVSSKGEIAYLRGGGEVYREGRKWFSARGASQLVWSPDGSRIAFVSNRGTHSFVGVVEGDRIHYLAPSVDRDANPVWSPDGRKVAFLRTAASTRLFSFAPIRSSEPWSIQLADAASGEAESIFRADKGPGSAYSPITGESQLIFTESGRIVFAWEKTGWKHLYAVRKGEAPKALTSGDFEVEHVSSSDGKTIFYSSNQGDIDRRHAWKVDPVTAKAEAITSGRGIEWQPAALSDVSIAMLVSDHQRPAHAAILTNGALKHFGELPAGFPKLQEPQPVIYSASDGMRIHAQVFTPSASFTGKRPAVVFLHGGSRRQMLLGWHYRGYYSNAYALNQYLASIGYVVLSINYRSGTGYGLNFREALQYGATGASEFQDVLGAGLYLRSRADVDPARIGLWGGSYGGYLTAMGLARASELFAAGVDIHGCHDWNNVIRNFVPNYNPLAQPEAAKLAFDSSPLSSMNTWRSPVLLIHGDDDRNVPFAESIRLAEALRKQNVEFEQLVFPDDVHDFLTHGHFLQAYKATADFLNKHLLRPR